MIWYTQCLLGINVYVFDNLCCNYMLCSGHSPFACAVLAKNVKQVFLSMVESQKLFQKRVTGCEDAI